MAATVIINRLTGTAPGSKTDITAGSTRLSASDSPSPGTTNSIEIPGSGTNYSYWASARLEVTVTPVGTVDNLNWHPVTPDPYGTGVTSSVAKASTGADAGYRVGVGTLGLSGTLLNTTNHTGLDGAPADIWAHTAGSPLALTGSISNPTTGDLGDIVVWQINIADTASAGTIAAVTARWRFDET